MSAGRAALASPRRVSRRLVLALAVALMAGRAAADDVTVPVSIQIDLLLKVASYDKNLAHRGHGRVLVAVLIKPDVAASEHVGAQALSALSEADEVVGLPVEPLGVEYTDAAALARLAKEVSIAVLYVTPGFNDTELSALARALDGISVLSAGALAKYTTNGTVLGFDLAGGKPKLLVHLARARRQRVDLSSSVLKLMRVIE